MYLEINGGKGVQSLAQTMFTGEFEGYVSHNQDVVDAFVDIALSTLELPGGAGTLLPAVDQINERIDYEEEKIAGARSFMQATNDFVDLAMRIDSSVATLVMQNREEFYRINPWLRPPEPEKEKGILEKMFDGFCEAIATIGEALDAAFEFLKETAVKAWEGLKTFYEEHTAEFWAIVATTILSIVAVALCPFTGGASLILYTAAVSAISAGIVSTVRSAETQYKEKGCIDWGEALIEGGKGAAIGFVTGAIGGAASQGLSNILSSSMSGLMSTSGLGTRMVIAFGIGAVSETGSGILTRGAESMLDQWMNTGEIDMGLVLDTAFDPGSMMFDAVLGGSSQASAEYHKSTPGISKGDASATGDRGAILDNGEEVSFLSDYQPGADAGIDRELLSEKTTDHFYSVEMNNGAKITVSADPCTDVGVANLNIDPNRQYVVLSGTHGGPAGNLSYDDSFRFYLEDCASFKNVPNVQVVNIQNHVSIDNFGYVIQYDKPFFQNLFSSGKDIVCAWCFSDRSMLVKDILGLR